MKQTTTWKNKGILWILLVILAGLIVCPLIMVFAGAVIIDGRLDLRQAWSIITDSENLQTIWNSLILGVCVVLCSTLIAAPRLIFWPAPSWPAINGWTSYLWCPLCGPMSRKSTN